MTAHHVEKGSHEAHEEPHPHGAEAEPRERNTPRSRTDGPSRRDGSRDHHAHTVDAEEVARWVADELGLDEYFAEVLPDRKSARIRELRERGWKVAMTGDGVNDAPALVEADVGIAIGAGTDVAIESADIVLVKSDPRDVTELVGLARATYRKMVQNLTWATGYNVVAIPLAAGVLVGAGVLLSPAVGAALMSVSTSATPSTDRAASAMPRSSTPSIGQPGVVSVCRIRTVDSSTVIS